MALIVASLLGIGALLFVLYPLYCNMLAGEHAGRRTTDAVGLNRKKKSVSPATRDSLAGEERAARDALHEVEFDYQLENLEQPEYQELRERYMQRALVAMKSRYDRAQILDDDIERQLRRLKEREVHAGVEGREADASVEGREVHASVEKSESAEHIDS